MDHIHAWIHLADLAIGRGPGGDHPEASLVREMLRLDVTQQREQLGIAPDAIVVTGGVARSGRPEEYAEARTFLLGLARAVGLAPERIFLVPGARDLAPEVDADRRIARLVHALREGTEDLDRALAEPADRALLDARRAHYRAFVDGLGDAPRAEGDGEISWSRRVEARSGIAIRFVGLDTAILATGDDRGALRAGASALGRALVAAAGDLIVVLSHHPFDEGWLAGEERVGSLVGAHAHVHLSGSPGGSASVRGLAGRVVRAAAGGAIAPDRSGHFAYAWNAVIAGADGAPRLRVWPRCYEEVRAGFMPDLRHLAGDALFRDFPLAHAWRAPAEPPPEAAALLAEITARGALLERRIHAAEAARTAAETREALHRLEAEIERYVGGAGDDLRSLHLTGVAISDDVRAAARALRRRAQHALARGLLRALLDEPSPAEHEVFCWSSLLVELGAHDDIALLAQGARALRFDFLPVHLEKLTERIGAASA